MCQARGASNISVQAHIETARLLSCKQNLDLHQFVRSRTHLAKSLSLQPCKSNSCLLVDQYFVAVCIDYGSFMGS